MKATTPIVTHRVSKKRPAGEETVFQAEPATTSEGQVEKKARKHVSPSRPTKPPSLANSPEPPLSKASLEEPPESPTPRLESKLTLEKTPTKPSLKEVPESPAPKRESKRTLEKTPSKPSLKELTESAAQQPESKPTLEKTPSRESPAPKRESKRTLEKTPTKRSLQKSRESPAQPESKPTLEKTPKKRNLQESRESPALQPEPKPTLEKIPTNSNPQESRESPAPRPEPTLEKTPTEPSLQEPSESPSPQPESKITLDKIPTEPSLEKSAESPAPLPEPKPTPEKTPPKPKESRVHVKLDMQIVGIRGVTLQAGEKVALRRSQKELETISVYEAGVGGHVGWLPDEISSILAPWMAANTRARMSGRVQGCGDAASKATAQPKTGELGPQKADKVEGTAVAENDEMEPRAGPGRTESSTSASDSDISDQARYDAAEPHVAASDPAGAKIDAPNDALPEAKVDVESKASGALIELVLAGPLSLEPDMKMLRARLLQQLESSK